MGPPDICAQGEFKSTAPLTQVAPPRTTSNADYRRIAPIQPIIVNRQQPIHTQNWQPGTRYFF